MSLIPTIYSSTDAGAPALSGTAGSLAAIFDAILVDGYGTGPSAKAPLGWTRPFSATNQRAYRNNPVTGTGLYVALDDTTAQYAQFRGYETMSAVNAGTNPFPTIAQFANGSLVPKSSAASSAVRAWWAMGNERSLYFFLDAQNLGMGFAIPHFVGDIDSLVPGDGYRFLVSATALTTYTGTYNADRTMFAGGTSHRMGSTGSIQFPCAFVARAYNLATTSPVIGCLGTSMAGPSNLQGWGDHGAPYPSIINGGLLYERGIMFEGEFKPRGQMPGLLVPLHPQPLPDLGTLSVPVGSSSVQVVGKRYRGRFASNNIDGQVLLITGREW